MMEPYLNPFQLAQQRVQHMCQQFQFDPAVYERLKQPTRTLEVAVPVRMDDGRLQTFAGFRCQYNNLLGPYKGGIRFHPTVTVDEIKALALWMTLKCGVLNLPYGGSKGGIALDPLLFSTGELERLSRSYVRAFAPDLGEMVDIPAPDVNTNSQIIGWMVDEYAQVKGTLTPAAFTGKPLAMGGSLGRTEATGYGVALMVRRALEIDQRPLSGLTIAIEGFGNVGSYTAYYLHQWGAKIVAVSNRSGCLYHPEGIDINPLITFVKTDKNLTHYQGVRTCLLREAIFDLHCDLFIPCAMENTITPRHAHRLQAKIVCEGANGPTTIEAEQILLKKGVLVIPDVLANSGGVVVSYFEWLQNRNHETWSLERVQREQTAWMVRAFDAVHSSMVAHHWDMRTAAYALSLERIATAMKQKEWY